MKYLKNKTLQESILLLGIGGWLVWYSLDGYGKAFNKDWSQSPFLFPIVMAGIMIVLALVLLGQGLRSAASAGSGKGVSGGSIMRTLAVLGLCLLYYAALSIIRLPYLAVTLGGITLRCSTFEVSTALFLAAMMFYLGVRKANRLILVPIGSALFLSIMFRSLLHVILP